MIKMKKILMQVRRVRRDTCTFWQGPAFVRKIVSFAGGTSERRPVRFPHLISFFLSPGFLAGATGGSRARPESVMIHQIGLPNADIIRPSGEQAAASNRALFRPLASAGARRDWLAGR